MKEKMTLQDWMNTVEKLVHAGPVLELVALQKELTKFAQKELGLSGERFPVAIVPEHNSTLHCEIEPWIKFQLEHVVFPADVARSYELASIQVHNINCIGAPKSIPLEVFSIDVYAQQTPDKLLDVMKWKVPDVYPSQKLHFFFAPIVQNPPPIRGIGWVRVLSY